MIVSLRVIQNWHFTSRDIALCSCNTSLMLNMLIFIFLLMSFTQAAPMQKSRIRRSMDSGLFNYQWIEESELPDTEQHRFAIVSWEFWSYNYNLFIVIFCFSEIFVRFWTFNYFIPITQTISECNQKFSRHGWPKTNGNSGLSGLRWYETTSLWQLRRLQQ